MILFVPWIGTALKTIAGPAINAISNVVTGKSNRRHAEKMWEKQQKYNTPENQMARLAEAGINPHLAFSSGNINNVSTSAPESPPMQAMNVGANEMLLGEQADVMKSQVSLNEANRLLNELRGGTEEQTRVAKLIENSVEMVKTGGGLEVGSKEWTNAIERYALPLRHAQISEAEAKKAVSAMEERLARNNITPGTDPIYRAVVGILDWLGIPLPNLEQLKEEQ